MRATPAIVALCAVLATPAVARPSPVTSFVGDRYGATQAVAPASMPHRRTHIARRVRRHVPVPKPRHAPSDAYRADKGMSLGGGIRRDAARVIGGRPAGCPHAFCGCGASLHLFGRIIPALNLAANWLRFPRALPAPRMVAARRGHVFVLERHIVGLVWLVHDSNSGGHRTRVHPRSIAGYRIVNPHGRA